MASCTTGFATDRNIGLSVSGRMVRIGETFVASLLRFLRCLAIRTLREDAYNRHMKHIGAQLKNAVKKTNETERGELMKYFCQELNKTRVPDGLPPVSMGRMGKLLQQIPTKDLYFLKTVCDRSPNFSKKFWWEIKPENHTPEARRQSAARFKEMNRKPRES